jgi:hypothetical protein
MSTIPQEIARGLTRAQREAVIDGRVHECRYNHPVGTKCPNCKDWFFSKGGSSAFVTAVRAILTEGTHDNAD